MTGSIVKVKLSSGNVRPAIVVGENQDKTLTLAVFTDHDGISGPVSTLRNVKPESLVAEGDKPKPTGKGKA